MCGVFAFWNKGTNLESAEKAFPTIVHRGPDSSLMVKLPNAIFGFHRLAIMDLSSQGNQPFQTDKWVVICNGEIYNYPQLHEAFKTYPYHSTSDCEVLLPLLDKYPDPRELCQQLDGEFAWIAWDKNKQKMLAGRDPIGIRPLFYGLTEKKGEIAFSSEAKALHSWCKEVHPFPPGHVYDGEKFLPYCDYLPKSSDIVTDSDKALKGIHDLLIQAVDKRLQADAPLGFLLSGGLDSSLVCAIAARQGRTLQTFSVGIQEDPIDVHWARKVAKHLKTQHTDIFFSIEDVYNVLPELIAHIETWDVTTVRASIGMYLMCRHIHKNTKIKCLMTGEVSDELFGYKYTDFAPNPQAFQDESIKRVRELYQYDVLRADRCLAAHALEARVPFADFSFVKFVMSIDPKLKMNTNGIGKFMLRKAFEKANILPHDILYREKAAFSDAVGHSMVDRLKAKAEKKYSDEDLRRGQKRYTHGSPLTKEGLWYREIFESIYPGRAEWIADYWLPNRSWENCDVVDPSARDLPNYGTSGE